MLQVSLCLCYSAHKAPASFVTAFGMNSFQYDFGLSGPKGIKNLRCVFLLSDLLQRKQNICALNVFVLWLLKTITRLARCSNDSQMHAKAKKLHSTYVPGARSGAPPPVESSNLP